MPQISVLKQSVTNSILSASDQWAKTEMSDEVMVWVDLSGQTGLMLWKCPIKEQTHELMEKTDSVCKR